MRNSHLLWMALFCGGLAAVASPCPERSRQRAEPALSARPSSTYGRLPFSFEANQGQTDARVRFLAHGQGYSLFLTGEEAVLALKSRQLSVVGGQLKRITDDGQRTTDNVLRMRLLGANAKAVLAGADELPGKSNYFIGNDPAKWRTDVPNYASVRENNLYPGVDVVYYGRQGQLEYDFAVAPRVDPSELRFEIQGAERLRITQSGDLELSTNGGTVVLRRPIAYQRIGELRSLVRVSYFRVGRNRFGFRLGAYRRNQPLVIDPVLTYSTYLGGSGGDVGYAVGVDSAGNAYVAGETNSTNFPTLNPEQGSSGGNGDGFIAKLNPNGTQLVYSTYIGGSGADTVNALALDSGGDVFVTGNTTSTNFPVVPQSTPTSSAAAFQTVYKGNGDAFVAELASTGSKLTYSSYLGGSGADFGQGIAVDSTGNAYVTGSTQSPDFPLLSPFQATLEGSSDVFITKVNFSGTALVYSTYLGGTQADTGQSIKVDSSGNAYVAGYTFSTNFPLQSAYQSMNMGDADVFISELNSGGSALVFSTYLGGTARDRAFGLALDSSGNIYVAGDTQSTDFPTTSGVFQSVYAGNGDAFATKLNAGGKTLSYSTYIGGTGVDQGNGIAVDSSGNAAIIGFTQSSDFPKVSPFQAILGLTGGSTCGTAVCADAFVTELNPSGGGANYSSFLGGSGADFGQAVAVDSSGNAYLAGSTSSSNFPAIAGVYQGTLGGVAGNAFVAKVESANSPAIAITPSKVNFGNETVSVTSSTQTVTVFDMGTAPLQITQITPPSSDFGESNNCVGTVAPQGSCTINVSFTPAATGSVTDQFSITDNAPGSPHTFTVTGTGVTQATAVTVAPTSLTFSNTNVSSMSAAQTVTITNTGSATLNITQIATTGDFTQTNNCSAMSNVLNVGQSCSVSVVFAPTASGSRTGTLSISDNATGSPQLVALSGNGNALISVAAKNPTISAVLGTTSVTYTITASAVTGFTGNISLSCATGVSCSFSSNPIFAGQSSTLTLSGLSATTANPYVFTVTGTSGSQSATVNLTVLLETFTLAGSPALDTVTAGAPANYTITVTPLFGFNQQVNLSCSNLPAGASCTFSPSSVTPNGTSPSSVAFKISTTTSTLGWRPIYRTLPPFPPGAVAASFGLLILLFAMRRPWSRAARTQTRLVTGMRIAVLGGFLLSLLLLAACRGISPSTSPTPTGNSIVTITGTLNSNTAVQVTTTVDLTID